MQAERELLALPVRMRGMGLTNPSQVAALEYVASTTLWSVSSTNRMADT